LFCDGLSVGGPRCEGTHGIQDFIDSFDANFEDDTENVHEVVQQIIDRVDSELSLRAGFLTTIAEAVNASCSSYRWGIYSQGEALDDFDTLYFSGNEDRSAYLPSDMAFSDLYGGTVTTTKSIYRLPNTVDYRDEHIQRDAAVSHMLEATMLDLHDTHCLDSDGTHSYCSMYFGTINGVFRVFPGTENAKDDQGNYRSYDPRFRPWYVSAASGSKDVVILLDISGSMKQYGRMDLAKSAVISVLSTLGPSSLVSVVAFNHGVELSCFGLDFVAATSRNVAKLIEFVEGLSATGGTDFEIAFNTAFDILEEGAQSCKTSILFLTDGIADGVASLVRSRNTVDIGAVVFSYTLGDGADTAVPRAVAEATGGIYTHVDDGDENLLTAMSSYYLYYAFGDEESNNDMIVTSPYLDFGTGMAMVTMALPVYFSGFFVGVAGIDIPLNFLSEAIGDVILGRKSYSFIVNQENEVILHPLVPDPLTTMFSAGDEYNPVYLNDLEPVEFDTSELMMGAVGTQKIEGTVKSPAGDVTVNGYTFSTEHLLYWYSAVGPNSLALGIVIYTDDATDAPNIPGFGFIGSPTAECAADDEEPSECIAPFVLYHDLRLMDSCEVDWFNEAGIEYDTDFGTEVSFDYAGWYLRAGGYESPNAAIHGQPTCDELEALHTFTNRMGSVFGSEMPFGGFRDELWSKLSNQIKVLPSLGQFWKSSYLAADSVFFGLYFASYQGLHISFPAKTVASPTYNSLIRPWYRRATSYPDLFTVTTPYPDFNTGDLVASGATVITAPGSTDTFGVAAFDYEFSEFLSYWDDTLSAVCRTSERHYCYLIDSNAFLLYYEGIAGDMNDADISHKFFGDLEPTLMQSLLDIGFFSNRTHANYLDDSLDVSYTANDDFYHVLQLNETARTFAYNSGEYTVHQITGTNLYLVFVDEWVRLSVYPNDCPDDAACSSVRSPGCVVDNGGHCASIVSDVCDEPDSPTLQSEECVWQSLDENSMCNLEKGVQSDFCASDFEEDCDSDGAIGGATKANLASLSALVLLLFR